MGNSSEGCRRLAILLALLGSADWILGTADGFVMICRHTRLQSLLKARKKNEHEELLLEMEAQVLASAKAQVDYNQVVKALSLQAPENGGGGNESVRSPSLPAAKTSSSSSQLLMASSNNNNNAEKNQVNTSLQKDDLLNPPGVRSIPSATWQVSLSAAMLFSGLTYMWLANVYVAAAAFAAVFVVANADPVDDDNVWGAVARLLGRQTLHSYQSTIQPKARALARAALTDEPEVAALQQRVAALQRENAQLREWQSVRLQAEAHVSSFTVAELKQVAREASLPVGGTKLQLLVRLLEHEALMIPEASSDDAGAN